MSTPLYSTLAWRLARTRALKRDGSRCTVARFFGGDCSPVLHVHHVVPLADGGALYDLDNLGTTCSTHHPMWEALRRTLVARLTAPAPRCRHYHRTAESRRICEERLARRSVAA